MKPKRTPATGIALLLGCLGVAVLVICFVLVLLGAGLQTGVLQAVLWGPESNIMDIPAALTPMQDMAVNTTPVAPPPPNQSASVTVVDNADSGFAIQTGSWGVCRGGGCSGVPYRDDFYYADPSCADCNARFELRPAQAGTYDLYAWWPRGDDRATDTPFTIQAGNQTFVVKINQRENGSAWHKVSTFTLNAGETVQVSVSASTTGYVNADAIALTPAGSMPPPPSADSATSAAVTAPVARSTSAVPPSLPAQKASGTQTKIIFLHHSTGAGIIQEGGLRERLTALGYEFYDHGYNDDGLTLADGTASGTNFAIPDDNTDPDGFAILFAQPVHSPPDNSFGRLLQYDVIAFKSCFPVSDIESNEQLEEYKTYYRNIRNVMDHHRDKLFVVITPPPLVPRATNRETAARARAFANWLKSPEYLNGHPNIVAFDLFQLLADDNPLSPEANMLRAAYRGGDPEDSHPNERANQAIGPQLADFLDRAVRAYPK